MNTLPSNVPDWPRRPPPRYRRTGTWLWLLLASALVGGVVAIVQTFVGFDQLARTVVSVTSTARLPGSDLPESRNWAGYAATGGAFTAVSATWNVPEFAPDSPAGADAIWIGIGGVHGNDLIQAGTQETVSGRGSTQYQAWVETLPQASRPVPLSISARDSISISLQQQLGGDWLITFANNTTGKSYQVTITMIGQRGQALARPSALDEGGASFNVLQSLL